MALKKIKAGNRANGASLGVEKSFLATLVSEHTLLSLALQAQRSASRFGSSPERARVVVGLAFNPGRRR